MKRTIVQKPDAYDGYPYSALSEDARRILFGCPTPPALAGKRRHTHVQRLECFLRITRQALSASDLRSSVGGAICDRFLAALYSEKFFPSTKPDSLYAAAYLARAILLSAGVPISPDHLSRLPSDLTPLRAAHLQEFNEIDLDEREVWLWSGWPSNGRRGITTHFPFVLLLDRVDRAFVDRLYTLCDEWFAARRAAQMPVLRRFCESVANFGRPLSAVEFLDSEFITDFWRALFKTHFVEGYADGTGSLLGTLRVQWESFRFFVEGSLVPGQLVAPAIGPFPRAPRDATPQLPTKRRRTSDGVDVSTKLLTLVPLQISDEEAIELLFRRVEADLNIVREWAHHEINDIWSRYQNRLTLADKYGSSLNRPEPLKKSPSAHEKLRAISYAASCIRDRGYSPSTDGLGRRVPIMEAAYALGLPTSGALLPHCVVLAQEHPAITPAFLENLELFDKNGRLTGVTDNDEGAYLTGVKSRRGPNLAQQTIRLNATTREVVRQIVALTADVRTYLKARYDDRWRYLLLSTNSAFGEARRVMRIASLTSDRIHRDRIRSKMLSLHAGVSQEHITDIAERLSLPAVRASSAVLRYLRTHSAHEMSVALGHADYDPNLLARYLPEPLWRFFQERWIRLFQNGIILEAMKGSPMMIDASDFETLSEVDDFLRNHALKLPSDLRSSQSEIARSESSGTEIVFGVDRAILTLLVSIRLAVEEANSKANEGALFWSEVAKAVTSHIEVGNTRRPDLESFLRDAKLIATAAGAAHLV